MKKLEDFISQNRKICWESHFEEGEYCIGENKVREFVEHLEARLKKLEGDQ